MDGRCVIQGSMADTDGSSAFQTFQKLDHDGRLDLRCWAALPGQDLDNIIDLGLRTGFGNDRLLVGHIIFFSEESQINFTHNKTPDGVTGTKGADYSEFTGRQIPIMQVKGDY